MGSGSQFVNICLLSIAQILAVGGPWALEASFANIRPVSLCAHSSYRFAVLGEIMDLGKGEGGFAKMSKGGGGGSAKMSKGGGGGFAKMFKRVELV